MSEIDKKSETGYTEGLLGYTEGLLDEIGVTTGGISEEVKKGAFFRTVTLNGKGIKDSRAASLTDDLRFKYRTKIEELLREIREKYRQSEDSLDLHPNSTISLEMAKNFKAQEFVDKDLEIYIEIRNLKIEVEIALARYEYLFGEKFGNKSVVSAKK